MVWSLCVEDASVHANVDCFLSIAWEVIVIIDEQKREVIFTTSCKSVIGWTAFQGTGSVHQLELAQVICAATVEPV